MNKKGAELSMNMIIIAVILLIALVVIVIIFSGKLGLFQKSSEETSAPFKANVCDVPGTGRYCSDNCFEGDKEVKVENMTCRGTSAGIGRCCCCKFA